MLVLQLILFLAPGVGLLLLEQFFAFECLLQLLYLVNELLLVGIVIGRVLVHLLTTAHDVVLQLAPVHLRVREVCSGVRHVLLVVLHHLAFQL